MIKILSLVVQVLVPSAPFTLALCFSPVTIVADIFERWPPRALVASSAEMVDAGVLQAS